MQPRVTLGISKITRTIITLIVHIPLTAFAAAGVARVCIGGSLARLTHAAIRDAAQAMLGSGDFSALANGIGAGIVDPLLIAGARGERVS